MPPRSKLTCIECLERLQKRVEGRIDALMRVRLDGNAAVISELRVELDYLRRALRYIGK
jgi:hypothetical protein